MDGWMDTYVQKDIHMHMERDLDTHIQKETQKIDIQKDIHME